MTESEKKTGFAFGFSKIKQKTTLVQTSITKSFDDSANKQKGSSKFNEDDDQPELITSIAGKKVQPVIQTKQEKKVPIIPCPKNELNIRKDKSEKDKDKPKVQSGTHQSNAEISKEDQDAINALIADAKGNKNEKKENNLKIELNSNKEKEEVEIEDPNYEAIDLEQFGMAALRGMGWDTKSGIGLSNKRSALVYEPELRPKGLGLGAGPSKKSKSDSKEAENGDNLIYSKGSYVQVLKGSSKGEYGQLISFDDGLNRILVKLARTGETISIVQNNTKLLTKSEYKKAEANSFKPII